VQENFRIIPYFSKAHMIFHLSIEFSQNSLNFAQFNWQDMGAMMKIRAGMAICGGLGAAFFHLAL
jgi:hypothetical protein